MEYTILLVIEVLAALGLIGLVLLQQGKGADMGASFGAGASQTIFGSSGSGNFMTRLTSIFALIFFLTCLGLAYLANNANHPDSNTVDFSTVVEEPELPAVPGLVGAGDASDASSAESPTVLGSGDGVSTTVADPAGAAVDSTSVDEAATLVTPTVAPALEPEAATVEGGDVSTPEVPEGGSPRPTVE